MFPFSYFFFFFGVCLTCSPYGRIPLQLERDRGDVLVHGCGRKRGVRSADREPGSVRAADGLRGWGGCVWAGDGAGGVRRDREGNDEEVPEIFLRIRYVWGVMRWIWDGVLHVCWMR
jgi:hypothetical protein